MKYTALLLVLFALLVLSRGQTTAPPVEETTTTAATETTTTAATETTTAAADTTTTTTTATTTTTSARPVTKRFRFRFRFRKPINRRRKCLKRIRFIPVNRKPGRRVRVVLTRRVNRGGRVLPLPGRQVRRIRGRFILRRRAGRAYGNRGGR